ncbi:MAG TPA: hypothetical protein VI248_13270 [Kineosporiaceae bacterium]
MVVTTVPVPLLLAAAAAAVATLTGSRCGTLRRAVAGLAVLAAGVLLFGAGLFAQADVPAAVGAAWIATGAPLAVLAAHPHPPLPARARAIIWRSRPLLAPALAAEAAVAGRVFAVPAAGIAMLVLVVFAGWAVAQVVSVAVTRPSGGGIVRAAAWTGAAVGLLGSAVAVLGDLPAGALPMRLDGGYAGPVTSVASSADGRVLVAATEHGMVRVTDLVTGHQTQTLLPRTVWVHAGADATQIVVGEAAGELYGQLDVWDPRSGRWIRGGLPPAPRATPARASWTQTQDSIYGRLQVLVLSLSPVKPGFTQRLITVDPVPAPDRTVPSRREPQLSALSVTPDAQALMANLSDGRVLRWDIPAGRWTLALPPPTGVTDVATTLAVSPDGATVAQGFLDGTIRLRDLASGRTQRTLHEWAVTGHPSTPRSLNFTPDGRALLSGSEDAIVRRWNLDGPATPPSGHGHP